MTQQLSIKAWRVNSEMTQKDVADKLGVTKQTVIRWESGEVPLRGLTIYALAKLYNTDIDNIRV
ncbi:XRE family transcriptional regulator [Macrococcoides goetzii]|uniref:helix-turn-helix transcriptional regulator n=1 Tax=Macrococcoides bohemicum TaxID=1903056 RepID=UPI00105A9381|nr:MULTISPECIES: helix-turn-helix transcriptional regulator [Macrococcus]TDL39433.1 XRE family transcriptional regulator [Macrococcus bohemicus]TDM41801.1 XRE family transcriptional regulator [Macrococcus goetzii]TDM48256.1 XRE family transcriptional regulator [Macrococcus goetzii]